MQQAILQQCFLDSLHAHAALCFSEEAVRALDAVPILFGPDSLAVAATRPSLIIPTDIDIPDRPDIIEELEFNGTRVMLYNPLPPPDGDDWEVIRWGQHPTWYRHLTGCIRPAWNVFSNVCDLLTFGEERRIATRDTHGRLPQSHSPRAEAGLADRPVFNDASALLMAAAAGLADGQDPRRDIRDLVLPLKVVLSHDCDILDGGDWVTQAIRLVKMFRGPLQGNWRTLLNPIWIIRNALAGRRFYFDTVPQMIDLERQLGFRSIFYILNGTGGRFGFRNKFEDVEDLLRLIPDGWDIGLHYNYDTFLDASRFADQKKQVEAITGEKLLAGRAHYLRFDPLRSFAFLEDAGIKFDESVGQIEANGYRAGVASVFRPCLEERGHQGRIWELPLQFWDCHLHQKADFLKFQTMLEHLCCVGGVTSVLFHPGNFYNPEFPEMTGVYKKVLFFLKDAGVASVTPADLLNKLKKYDQETVGHKNSDEFTR